MLWASGASSMSKLLSFFSASAKICWRKSDATVQLEAVLMCFSFVGFGVDLLHILRPQKNDEKYPEMNIHIHSSSARTLATLSADHKHTHSIHSIYMNQYAACLSTEWTMEASPPLWCHRMCCNDSLTVAELPSFLALAAHPYNFCILFVFFIFSFCKVRNNVRLLGGTDGWKAIFAC